MRTLRVTPFFYLLVLLSVTFPYLSCDKSSPRVKTPAASNGVLDLAGWDLDKNGSINLDGGWEFYWGMLLAPSNFQTAGERPRLTGIIKVPSVWNSCKTNNAGLLAEQGGPLPAKGYATYRLRLVNAGPRTDLGLRAFSFGTAYNLWVNGAMLASNGTVSADGNICRPEYRTCAVTFRADRTTNEIVIQVANFHYSKGGFWERMRMGTADRIRRGNDSSLWLDSFLAGGLLIISIYHLAIFLIRRKDPSSIFFSALCALVCLRTISTGSILLTQIFPNFPWDLTSKCEYLSFYLGTGMFGGFLYFLFRSSALKWPNRVIVTVSVLFSLLVALAPPEVFSVTLAAYQVFTMLGLAFWIVLLAVFSFRKNGSAMLILAGLVVFGLTLVNDILYSNQVLTAFGFIGPAGILLFALSQSFVLSLRFSGALTAVEAMTANLEKKVVSRTKELQESLEIQYRLNDDLMRSTSDLNRANDKLREMDKLKTDTMHMVTHELRTPLTAIQGFTKLVAMGMDGILLPGSPGAGSARQNDLPKMREQIRLVERECERLMSLINDYLDLARLEEGKMEMSMEPFSMEDAVKDSLAVTGPLFEISGLRLETEIESGLPEVPGDSEKVMQVIINLVSNAVKFTPSGTITVRARGGGGFVTVSVADTGPGIPESQIDTVFEKFKQLGNVHARLNKGSGLGLPICRQIIEKQLGGRIWVESAAGKGSVFSFSLPVKPS